LRSCPISTRPEAGLPKPAYELLAAHRYGARRHHRLVQLLGHVVVVALESSPEKPDSGGERVQLVERLVRDEMRPQLPVPRPDRSIDKDHRTAASTASSTSVRHDRTMAAST